MKTSKAGPYDASDRTLGLVSIWQVLRKFAWEIEIFKLIPESVRIGEEAKDALHIHDARLYAAINAFSTSLALVDWLYHTVVNDPVLLTKAKSALEEVDFTSDKEFLASLRRLNPAINVSHQICNANKHFHLKSPMPDFRIMVADMLTSHEDGTKDITVLMTVTQNGSNGFNQGKIENILKELANWWYDRLVEIGIPQKDVFFL